MKPIPCNFKTILSILVIIIYFTVISIHTSFGEPARIIKIVGAEYSAENSPESEFISPQSIVGDAEGRIFVSDSLAQSVYELKPAGRIEPVLKTSQSDHSGEPDSSAELDAQRDAVPSLQTPLGIAVDSKRKRLLIAEAMGHKIRYIDTKDKIHTLAGSGESGYNGDGFWMRRKRLNQPKDVAVDSRGNVYIADTLNHRVRRVGRYGRMVTVAGTGEAGYSGDGGQAKTAQLNEPSGLAVDASGNLYIADTLNHCVRRVGKNGHIVTIAGNGEAGFGGNGIPAVNARLNTPTGLAVDTSGNLYIADTLNYCIRRVDSQGVISNVMAGLDRPTDVFVTPDGDIYIVDVGMKGVIFRGADGQRLFSTGYHWQDLLGGGQPALEISLLDPAGLDVAADGSVVFVDKRLSRVYRYTTDGIVAPIAGNGSQGYTGDDGPALEASFSGPTGVLLGIDGSVFIADTSNHCIRQVTPNGKIQTIAGNGNAGFAGDGGLSSQAQLFSPSMGLAMDGDGNLFIADSGNNRIRMMRPDGIIQTVVGGGSRRPTEAGVPALEARLRIPQGIALSRNGNLYILESGSGIQVVDGNTGLIHPWMNLSSGERLGLNLDVDAQGNVYLAETYQHRITCWHRDGQKRLIAGSSGADEESQEQPQFYSPIGIRLTSDGNLIFAASRSLYMAMDIAAESKSPVWPISPAYIRHLDPKAIVARQQQKQQVEAEVRRAFEGFQKALASEEPEQLKKVYSRKTLQMVAQLDQIMGGEGRRMRRGGFFEQMQQAAKNNPFPTDYTIRVTGERARIVLKDSPNAIYEFVYEADAWKLDMSASIEALLEKLKTFDQDASGE